MLGTAAITDVGRDDAADDPTELVAVTVTRSVEPTSAAVTA